MIELIYTVDDETFIIPLEASMVEGNIPESAGEHTITASYQEESITFSITLEENPLTQTLMNIYEHGISEGMIDFDSYDAWLASIQGEDGISIEAASIDQDGMLILTFSDGQTHNAGLVKAQDGISVVNSEINDAGHLILTMSDGETINAGIVKGSDAAAINTSFINDERELILVLDNGQTINAGVVKGQDGISIVDSTINAQGQLILTMSNNESINVGNVVGEDGAYIENSTINAQGELIFTLTSGEIINAGSIVSEPQMDIEFRLQDDALQWRYLDNPWQDLIPATEDEEVYTITFVEPWSGVVIKEMEVSESTPLVLPSISMIGHEMQGWYADLNYNYEIDFYDYAKSDMTLYVKWGHIPNQGYEIVTDKALITGNHPSYSKHLFIPAEINGYSVEAIDAEAFAYRQDLKHVYVARNLKVIGAEAFLHSSIEHWHTGTFNNIESIGKSAFEGSNLKAFTIPSGVNVISESSFKNTGQLTTIDFELEFRSTQLQILPSAFENSALKAIHFPEFDEFDTAGLFIGGHAFKNTYNLSSIDLPDSTILNGLSELSEVSHLDEATMQKGHIFDGSALETFVLPTKTSKIGDYDFANTKYLQTIELHDHLTHLGIGAFDGAVALEEIDLISNIYIIAERAFANTESLLAIDLPETVNTIGREAFKNSAIASIHIPNPFWVSFTIENGAFAGTQNLTTLTLPDNINTLGEANSGENHEASVFKDSGLEEITIPNSVNIIHDNVFYGAKNLHTIHLHDNISAIGDYAFAYTESLTSITLPELESIGIGIFQGSAITTIALMEGATSVPEAFFKDMLLLSHVILPESIENIESYAFENTPNLSSLTFGDYPENTANDALQTIGTRAFRNSGLQTLYFTELSQLTAIKREAFASSEIKEIHLPNSLETIELKAFAFSTLESVNINEGSNLSTIEAGAFIYTNIESFFLPKGVVELPFTLEMTYSSINYFGVFTDSQLASITFEENSSLEIIATNSFRNTNLTSIELPKSIQSIGAFAFSNTSIEVLNIPYQEGKIFEITASSIAGMDELKTLALNADMTALPEDMFQGRENLEHIVLPNNITIIGEAVFRNMPNLSTIVLPESLISIEPNAFRNTGLKTITLPQQLEIIGNNAFRDNTQLTTVIFEQTSNLQIIGASAFRNTTSLETIKIEGAEQNQLPDSLITISAFAFNHSNIPTLHFSETAQLTTLEGNAFSDSNIKVISIPKSLTTIGISAFENSLLHTINIEPDSNLSDIGGAAFAHTYLESFYLPSGIRELPVYARLNYQTYLISYTGVFSNTPLSSIEIPQNSQLENIGGYTFSHTNLMDINLPDTLEYIGYYAFSNSLIETLNIPYQNEKIFSISAQALRNMDALKTVDIQANMEMLPEGVFKNLESLETVILPETLNMIPNETFKNTPNLTHVSLPSSAEYIGESAFEKSGITSLDLPETLLVIDAYAFYQSGLETILLPNALHAIGPYAFAESLSLTTVSYQEYYLSKLNIIEDHAFASIPITEMKLPEYLTYLGNSAFANTNLEELIIYTTDEHVIDLSGFDNLDDPRAPLYNTSQDLIIYLMSETQLKAYSEAKYWGHYQTFYELYEPSISSD